MRRTAFLSGFFDEMNKQAIEGTPIGRTFSRKGISEFIRPSITEKLRTMRKTLPRAKVKKELETMRDIAVKAKAKAGGREGWWLK